MKLKLNEEGYAEVQDGKPVYVDDNGKEIAYDAPAMHAKIGELNKEAQRNREAKEEIEGQLKSFEGIDPEKAQEALKTLKNLDDKKLIDAGEVERVKGETAAAYEKRIKEMQERADKLESQYASEKLSSAFANSKFVKDRVAVPPDMLQRTFSDHFEFKDGRITPKDANGNPIYSDSNPGDVANFDEALEKIVSQYPYRDSILKGTGNSGSGSQGVDGDSGARVINRKYFESQSPGKQAELAKAMNEGKVKLEG
jgi:hypothetical protein